MFELNIEEEILQDIINIETGLLWPLHGFMGYDDYRSVLDQYTMVDGNVFTIPITLDIPKSLYEQITVGDKIILNFSGEPVAEICMGDKFIVTDEDIQKVFLTLDLSHAGVNKEKARSPYRVGGKTTLLKKDLLKNVLSPYKTKKIFKENRWESIVGFQTRNPIHKAHEHIQRIGLEFCDGLFINPIIGWKKIGDFTEEAVISAYAKMIEEFYPKNRFYIEGLKTQMRYAGPREAIFHAIIRRNLGCTHFIIGRDHAGVGGFYSAYDAHELAKHLQNKYDIGIKLLLTREPYYCEKCKQIVTDKTCGHYETHRVEISGTKIRKYLSDKAIPDETVFRKEIFEAIINCKQVFITE